MRKYIDTRTYRDRAKYNVMAVTKRRKRLKVMAVESRGGRCQLCGYNKCVAALDFHHIDESDKEFSLGTRGLTRSWQRIEAEIKKCVLVCANCHREIHAGIVELPNPTLS
jgi:hypothetical protein